MRIEAVSVKNVGGLMDGRVEVPHGSITALAGANGTGKSKLLACILAPWTGQVPNARGEDDEAEVLVEMRLTASERQAIQDLSETMRWGEANVPDFVQIGVRCGRLTGPRRFSIPQLGVLDLLWAHHEFLAVNPGLNVVFLPAERRLLEPLQSGIDLNQLSDAIASQRNAESRNTVTNYGRLDDQEFESFAKALCVAASLPPEDESSESAQARDAQRIGWDEFRATVNALIAPKKLLGLTRNHSDQLRVQTSQGHIHSVRDLSSGERQALIIISRVLRAGTRAPLVMIDEPDAYLHPHLSKRLILALEDGVGQDGQLIVATHSPSILDGIPPAAILRLEHGGLPQSVADEAQRLELYRGAGFRSSALTQSDLLLMTEGTMDTSILTLSIPELSRASVKDAGGKAQVLRAIEQLKPYDLPVLGVVDLDLASAEIEDGMKDDIYVWPSADIEGVFLSDAVSLQTMIECGLMKPEYQSVEQLRDLIDRLCEDKRENVIAEIARAQAVQRSGYEWPSPRGLDPLERLRVAVRDAMPISEQELEQEIAKAEEIWKQAQGQLLRVVRGKYIIGAFTSQASEMKSHRALLEAVARQRPKIEAIDSLAQVIGRKLNQAA